MTLKASVWLSQASEVWPGLVGAVAEERFLRWLNERAEHTGPTPRDATHAAELLLAFGCAQGIPQALETLEAHYLRRVGGFVAGFDASSDFADEVRQALRETLLLGERPRIGDFTGRGSLVGFLRIAAHRVALRLRSKQPPPASASQEPSAIPDVAAPSGQSGPEGALARLRDGPRVREALESAIDGLSREERTWLKLYHLDGASLQRIAQLYGVHTSTLWRRLQAVSERLLEAVRARLQSTHGVAQADVESLIVQVRSHLDLSLRELLASR